MSLVLFIVGLLGLVSIYANHLSSFYQNNFEVFVFFAADTDELKAQEIQKQMNQLPFINKTSFIDREVAARKEIARTGEDFIKTLGYNPIPHSVQINIKSEFADEQKMQVVEKQLRLLPQVDDVVFAKDDLGKNILSQINKNFNTIKTILMALAGVLLFISLLLINSTVRINMFARRFIIKSMQYVGASDWFIIKPFIKMYLVYALVSTFIALGLLFGLVYLAETNLQFNNWQLFIQQYLLLSGVLFGLAIVISLISVYFSTKRYLKLKIDQLY
jgi:cell division transport system permease protein